jgi:hypothetical protein
VGAEGALRISAVRGDVSIHVKTPQGTTTVPGVVGIDGIATAGEQPPIRPLPVDVLADA